jgi:hypothetical protein
MVNLVVRQHTFICFTCCLVWRGMSTAVILNKNTLQIIHRKLTTFHITLYAGLPCKTFIARKATPVLFLIYISEYNMFLTFWTVEYSNKW